MPRNEKPIDMSRGPVAKFAADLRDLRRGAGTPTYREMATRVHYSMAVLSQAAAGATVPRWPVVEAFVTACGGDPELWRRHWENMCRDQAAYDATSQPVSEEPTLFTAVRDAEARQDEHGPRNTRPAVTVFILDDHEVLRSGLRMLLEREPDITVIGEAATVAEALVRIPALKPDVAILDIRLPDGNGVSVCREIRANMESPPACLMFTSYSDDDALFDSIMAGAAGYLLKQASSAALVKAVRTVAGGGSLLDSTLTTSLMGRLRSEDAAPDFLYAQLSPQERRILDHIADGLTNRQIAEKLYLAERTVKNYVSSLLNKLGVQRRSAAAAYGAERRLKRGG